MDKNQLKIIAESLIDTFETAGVESIKAYEKGLKIEIHERKRKKFIKGKASVNSFDIEHKPKFVDDIQYFLSYYTQY